MKTEMKIKMGKRIKLALTVFLTLGLALGVYTLQYHTVNKPEALEKAAKEYVELGGFEMLDKVQVKNGILLVFKADGVDGTVTFQRGWNGLWSPVNAHYSDSGEIINVESFSDYSFFRAKEQLVVYSVACPADFGRYEVEYYNQQAFEEDGRVILETYSDNINSPYFATLYPYVDRNYIHEIKAYDKEGKPIPAERMYKPAESSTSTSRTTAELELLDGFCTIVLVLGALAVRKLMKKEIMKEKM